MIDQLAATIVDEANWLPFSMTVALVAVALVLYRYRDAALSGRDRTLAALNLFYGVTIGVMAVGHLLAVFTKLAQGTLEGSVPTLVVIGVLVGLPAWWLVWHVRGMVTDGAGGRATIVLNAWLGATLVLLGLHNLPIAVPALFNIGYRLHSRRAVGWTMVGLAGVVQLGLFIGSVIFMASGQSFEQFSGME